MSDQQPPIQHQNPQEGINDGPPMKRACMNDTPPIALTPADDGSDFYNTPWAAQTPVETSDNKDSATQGPTSDPAATSHPSTLIPGLNLVNDSLKDVEPVKTEPKPSPNTVNEDSVRPDVQTNSEPPTTEVKEEQTSAVEVEEEQTSEPTTMEVKEQTPDVEVKAEQTSEQQNQAAFASTAQTEAVPEPDAMDQDLKMEDEEEHPEWEVDSSPYESSSDDSSDSDDSDSDDEDYPILSPEEQARILMQAELGSDDEGEGKGKSGGHIRTANEVLEEAPPVPEVTVTPEMKIVVLGHVEAVIENTVLIAANTSGEYQVLEAGSLLCFEDRSIAGVVCETLGRVENPLYTVRFPSATAVEERGLTKGKIVYYVEQHSTFVFTQPLKGMKGSDASNFHDEEIAEDEVEFSDDEAEAEYKKKLKQKRQERKEANGASRGKKGPPGPSKLNQSELNYDDNTGEDGYTPLARPKNLHEMMGKQEAPVEGDGPSARGGGFRGGRGRGRGSDRGGRGGRGRGGAHRDNAAHHDRQPYQQQTPDAQSQPPANYMQQAPYPRAAQPHPYPMPQPLPYPPQQQQQQQPYAQGAAPFNFQMPFQQAYPQPNPYQFPPNMQLNPLFLAALQQQQQQYQQPQQAPGQQPPQAATMNFDQVKAQLDLLRQLSNNNNNNQGPPRS
ncbi:Gar1/Naf1 RNA binding region-domain-containing protein [Aspergillus avenaceus]|uniref:H/ACA ribonucleoprotein complex non-core subunit NAF1 n=1 Tax=Aspergillus avenaceus TaxID=36643 RepID=A0A5N6U5I8_ASPAV|nr:Gar1/Naf1 RNA binding region-domain-containing protein [Aspergillus avenaceus]